MEICSYSTMAESRDEEESLPSYLAYGVLFAKLESQ